MRILHIATLEGGDKRLTLDPILERKVKVLMELRKYKMLEREEKEGSYYMIVKTSSGEKLIIWVLPTHDAVGVKYLNQLAKEVESRELDGGIIISSGRYTLSAKSNGRKSKIELIPPIFPSFNIFKHHLVPLHEILTPEEKMKVLKEYRVKPYQLPRIKTSDPVAKAIGAKPGDLIKIIRKSPTAGDYVSYRYVVEG